MYTTIVCLRFKFIIANKLSVLVNLIYFYAIVLLLVESVFLKLNMFKSVYRPKLMYYILETLVKKMF